MLILIILAIVLYKLYCIYKNRCDVKLKSLELFTYDNSSVNHYTDKSVNHYTEKSIVESIFNHHNFKINNCKYIIQKLTNGNPSPYLIKSITKNIIYIDRLTNNHNNTINSLEDKIIKYIIITEICKGCLFQTDEILKYSSLNDLIDRKANVISELFSINIIESFIILYTAYHLYSDRNNISNLYDSKSFINFINYITIVYIRLEIRNKQHLFYENSDEYDYKIFKLEYEKIHNEISNDCDYKSYVYNQVVDYIIDFKQMLSYESNINKIDFINDYTNNIMVHINEYYNDCEIANEILTDFNSNYNNLNLMCKSLISNAPSIGVLYELKFRQLKYNIYRLRSEFKKSLKIYK